MSTLAIGHSFTRCRIFLRFRVLIVLSIHVLISYILLIVMVLKLVYDGFTVIRHTDFIQSFNIVLLLNFFIQIVYPVVLFYPRYQLLVFTLVPSFIFIAFNSTIFTNLSLF